jgi:hypothetical protein
LNQFDEIIQNQNQINNKRFESLFELIRNHTEINQNNSKLNNERIDKLYDVIQNQNEIYQNNSKMSSEKINKLNEMIENQSQTQFNQSRLNNERIDKLYDLIQNQNEIIENQSQLQINMSKSILNLENKLIFDWKKYILSSNMKINELLNQGFETVYDQLYSYVTTNQELYDIKYKCNRESIICVGGSDGLSTLLLVSCGSCLDILTTTELNKPRLVNGVWWYFTPDISFGFAPFSSIRQSTADVFDCDSGGKNCNDSKRLSWHLQGSGGWRLGSLNNNAKTIPSQYRKIILML